MSLYRDTYAKINLKYLKDNIETVYHKFKRPLMAVIKADAYGHGYHEVAKYIKDIDYIEMFAVATLPEAIELRELGIEKGILVLGAVPTTKEEIDLAIKYDITLTMISLEYMHHLTSLIDDKPLKVHIKLDTGMHRIGLTSKEELDELLAAIDRNKFVLDGIFTHYATADGQREAFEKQREMFYRLVGDHQFKYIHCCNSAAMTYHHDTGSNLGRIGIVMYGIDPAGQESDEYKQVMSLYSKVSLVKQIKKGEQVGYGLIYTANEDEYIATIPIGYADGLIRKNQGRKVYIAGKYYEIVGRVCMDQMMVRVDETIKAGDQVEIFGEHISLASMAKELDTIPYEIICLISKRVERVYVK
ncbi:alanine racemase [Thomasclavelia sp.]|uniref:alanine racemase n=1 Tax=Thomasclavelia sp. TaxID=3025757 RepID=UPI0025DF90B9|nr:alanine racemase [Thomasclavelia sp.]